MGLWVEEKTYLKKKISTKFLSDHSSSGLTRWVDLFTLGQLQAQILNETDPANAIRSWWQKGPTLLKAGPNSF
jgi:hypothetical protein